MKKLFKKLSKTVNVYSNLIDTFIEEKDTNKKFIIYDKIKEQHTIYLEIKKELKEAKIDLTDNDDVQKFKDYHQKLQLHERELLFDGVNVKEKLVKNNDGYLDRASEINRNTTQQLLDGLRIVEETRQIGQTTVETLEDNKDKIKKINHNLDETQGELKLANTLMTRFLKRIATDKVIIAFTTLVFGGATGIGLHSAGII